MDFYRPGANFEDRNAIRRYAEQGMSAEDISKLIQVKVDVVEKFMPGASKPKSASPKKAARRVKKAPAADDNPTVVAVAATDTEEPDVFGGVDVVQ
jgi:ribosome-binding protein aMBF1 (putative translation factor)